MYRQLVIVCVFMLNAFIIRSQSIGIGTSTPSSSALLEVNSSSKGLLIPRMTTAQRDAIASPANGLTIYNTTTRQFNYHDGQKWQVLTVLPKGAIVASYEYDSPDMKSQGFTYSGFLSQDITNETIGDTTIAANHWYKGNTYYSNNAGAPGCSESNTSIFIDSLLYCFTYDTIYIYSRATDKWRSVLMNPAFHNSGVLGVNEPFRIGNRIVFWDIINQLGCRYDFVNNNWETMNIANAPSYREGSRSSSNGTDIFIWGGRYFDYNTSQYVYPAELYKYNPVANTWTIISGPPGFQGRLDCSMACTGNGVLIWGGRRIYRITGVISCSSPLSTQYDSSFYYTDGRLYNISSNTWTTLPTTGAPSPRHNAAVVFDGSGVVITGGRLHRPGHPYCTFCPPISFCIKYENNDSLLKSGARYDPVSNAWTAIPNAPRPFAEIDPLWDNDQYITLFIADDTTLCYEPSAGDWFINLYPALDPGYAGSRRTAFAVNNSDLIIIQPSWPGSPAALSCWSSRKAVYNLRPAATTIRTIKISQLVSGVKIYLYKKE